MFRTTSNEQRYQQGTNESYNEIESVNTFFGSLTELMLNRGFSLNALIDF